MNKNRSFYGVTVGNTNSGKVISAPYDVESKENYTKQFGLDYDYYEVFEIYAIFEYLSIRELRKFGTDSKFLKTYQSISKKAYSFLDATDKLASIKEKAGIKNSLGVLKLGRSLVLPEFKGV